MSFGEKIKSMLRSFMVGRHGPDQLTMFTLIAGLAFDVLAMIFGLGILSTIGLVLYIFTIFRMFSRNNVKRNAENDKYLMWSNKIRTWFSQKWNMLKNSKKYKYVRCPQCKQLLRLPRKVGNVHITCSKCGNGFDAKA